MAGRRLAQLAGEWDLSLSQVALAYMLTLPGMGPLIPSASTVEQLASNAAAGKTNLSAGQLTKIRDVLGGRID